MTKHLTERFNINGNATMDVGCMDDGRMAISFDVANNPQYMPMEICMNVNDAWKLFELLGVALAETEEGGLAVS